MIPLLSDYVVGAGFVSARDFLIGLVSQPIVSSLTQAIIQALPGPNFVSPFPRSMTNNEEFCRFPWSSRRA